MWIAWNATKKLKDAVWRCFFVSMATTSEVDSPHPSPFLKDYFLRSIIVLKGERLVSELNYFLKVCFEKGADRFKTQWRLFA